ncbi:NADPH:adrenodoxin oxidoreductase, mitochondrial isoform X2 [Venturia canescens]|uniref:NADPH:adrenodoxin oxidoreductase, mitochondrial isoform X2 n=1 Tax=Venturia canescens TaxID=32260 RepID=UPI001C9BFE6A|nr:NADPH:adrenodoxin oxidoreductase, mitochondrial isoform X2 [Venturia canescens]
MKLNNVVRCARNISGKSVTPNVCIVGAGPAGFYAAQQLIKTSNDVKVDILERLPVPFGLVRFGVAPDHPEVKNVINTFHKTAINPRVRFLGNVNVGKDVRVEQLMENYHAVLLTYGAEEDRELGIPGEDLKNVISGRKFVGWYNGSPNDRDLGINLDVEEAIIVGQGNVAIDIARILLSPIDRLRKTDITSYALEQLSRSRIRKVSLIGRRGPLQAAFTIAELREMVKLEKCETRWRAEDFTGVRDLVANLPRPRKRITELMLKSLEESPPEESPHEKKFFPIFLRSPSELLGLESVEKIRLHVNELNGEDYKSQSAKPTDSYEEIPCGLALRSIGYKSVAIDDAVPFDQRNGRIVNNFGKIDKNLYAAGWVATGPVGVILSTMTNAFQVAGLICKELLTNEPKEGTQGLLKILRDKNVQTVSYDQWKKIDEVEREMGKKLDKPREKIVDVKKMLEIAFK